MGAQPPGAMDQEPAVRAESESSRDLRKQSNDRGIAAGIVLGLLAIGIGTGVGVGLAEHSAASGALFGVVGFVGSYLLMRLLLGPLERLTMWLLEPAFSNISSLLGSITSNLWR
jgi:predicted transporter